MLGIFFPLFTKKSSFREIKRIKRSRILVQSHRETFVILVGGSKCENQPLPCLVTLINAFQHFLFIRDNISGLLTDNILQSFARFFFEKVLLGSQISRNLFKLEFLESKIAFQFEGLFNSFLPGFFFWILALVTIKTLKFTKRIMPECGKLLRRISLEFQVLSNLFKFVSYCILFILTRLVACYNLCLRKRTVAWLSFAFISAPRVYVAVISLNNLFSLSNNCKSYRAILYYNIFELCFVMAHYQTAEFYAFIGSVKRQNCTECT